MDKEKEQELKELRELAKLSDCKTEEEIENFIKDALEQRKRLEKHESEK